MEGMFKLISKRNEKPRSLLSFKKIFNGNCSLKTHSCCVCGKEETEREEEEEEEKSSMRSPLIQIRCFHGHFFHISRGFHLVGELGFLLFLLISV
jgi:hypothetical protein